MRTSGGEAAPLQRWATVPFRLFVAISAVTLLAFPAEAAVGGGSLDARWLLAVGINLGIIIFAVGTAIGFLRVTKRAQAAEKAANAEAERYRHAESSLETVLTAEPQLLMSFGDNGEPELLASAYRRSLELAGEKGLASIAFPGISTGVYGYPADQAAELALSTVTDTLPAVPSVQEVVFCCFSDRDLTLYRNLGVGS